MKKRETVPCLIIRVVDDKSDRLVILESAIQGESKGTLSNRKHRGIPHCDIIDLRYEDYREFDVFLSYARRKPHHCLATY